MDKTRILIACMAVLALGGAWMFRYDTRKIEDNRIYKIDRWTGATVICTTFDGRCKKFPVTWVE